MEIMNVMKTGNKYNWAILGCGKIAIKFSHDLKLLPNARLYAAASRNKKKAHQFANEHGFERAYGNYEQMLQDSDVDIVYIATPHSHHHDHTLLCLKYKKAVLCEKAFAINLREVKEMVDFAKQQKVFLMEAFWTQFQPSFHKAMEIVKSRRLGRLRIVRSDFAFNGEYDVNNRLYNISLGGGSLLDIGIYPVFASLIALGKPNEIKALADFSPTSSEESIGMIFKYENGCMATLTSSFAAHASTQSEYWCEKGFLRLERRWHEPTSIYIWHEDNKEERINLTDRKGFGYQYEALHVMECLDKGLLESPEMPHSLSMDLMEILDAVRKEAGIVFPAHD